MIRGFAMNNLFLILLSGMVVFTHLMSLRGMSQTDTRGLPTLYWVTDNNPLRAGQLADFHRWLMERGHPPFRLVIDNNNAGNQKIIIQTLAGVAGDILDINGSMGPFFAEMGVAQPVRGLDTEYGYPDTLVPEILRQELMLHGTQIGFPHGLFINGLLVNLDILEKYGMPEPPVFFEEKRFEAMAGEFCRKANASGGPRHYFLDSVNLDTLRHGYGVSPFNETLTASDLDHEGTLRALRKIREWTVENRWMPTAADMASFSVDAGYGGTSLQLWAAGRFACIQHGRHAMIQTRAMNAKVRCSYATVPYGMVPYVPAGTRMAILYRGGKHQNLARAFLAYLRSPEYSLGICRSSDGIPPDLSFVRSEAFRKPPAFPHEWNLHERVAILTTEVAQGREYSPFCLFPNYLKREQHLFSAFMSGLIGAEEAAKSMHLALESEISNFLEKHPDRVPPYRKAVEIQRGLDELKRQGRKVPEKAVVNFFLRDLYRRTGRLE